MDVYKNYINGEWRAAGNTLENRNPSDLDDTIGIYADSTPADVADAVSAACAASAAWAASTPQQRFDALDFIGTEILARKQELGMLLSREEGKTLPEGIGEVGRAGQIFKYFAGEALRMSGENLRSVRPGVEVEIIREPVGVVGLITPFNFPIAIPAWKIAPALAYGNTIVFKPAEQAPACAWALADIIARSGIPAGVFNMVMGFGETGAALVENKNVAAVSFTGSILVGRQVAATCVGRMAKVQLEMGGKNPLVVLDDADLDVAVGAAVNGAYFSTGQRCTASSRLIVTEGIHDKFIAAMVERMKKLRVDDALAEGTEIGPVIDDDQLQKNNRYIEQATKEGGRLVFGGERLQRGKNGFYMMPALISETRNEMTINQEEVFGPVASVIKVKDYDEALKVANDTPFGLSSGICTTSLKYASHFRRHALAGMVMVNLPTAGVDYHVPFGGRKGSSYGTREQGHYAMEFYTTVKTVYISPGM
jgi:acyl-CoA reductase-like NAD-dependent aldehyde dehydrogenase